MDSSSITTPRMPKVPCRTCKEQRSRAAEFVSSLLHRGMLRQLTPMIDLEYSRPQKDKGRDRSPDRNKNRGGRGADRYDGREGRRSRDDHRRESSPRRDDRRARENDHYGGRDRQADSYRSRGRSRSPNRALAANSRSRPCTRARGRRSPTATSSPPSTWGTAGTAAITS